MLHPQRIAYTFLGCFLTAIFLLQWWQNARYPRFLWIILGVCALNALGWRRVRALLLSAILGLSVAFLTVTRTTHVPSTRTADWYANGEKHTIHGVIAEEPDRRPLQTKYTIQAEELLTASGDVVQIEGRVLTTDHSGWPEYQYGDKVTVSGVLEKPGTIETFHYDRYLSRYGVYSVIYRAHVRSDSQKKGSRLVHSQLSILNYQFFKRLFGIKQRFENQINKLYAEPHASFLAGLLTGSRRGIPKHLMEDFNRTGLTHIIAISGFNITIVISVISGALFWLPLKWRFVPAVTAIALFTIFVGASAAVVRASIMGILGLLALQTERLPHTRLMILWTLFFMICWNPKMLWYDAGFQLSFLAVLGLTECASLLDRLFEKVPKVLGMREALQMTISAQITAVPLIVMLFGRLSLIAPIANILVAPAIPLAMLFGFLGTILSTFWFPLGQCFAYVGWAFLEWMVTVAHVLSRIPLASLNLPSIGAVTVSAYYLLLVMILLRRNITTYRCTASSRHMASESPLPVPVSCLEK